MRVLYKRTGKEPPENLELNEVENDIVLHWKPNYNLFTLSQMCDRHKISKRACRRKIKRFLQEGIIERHN